jgi:hypothetical protein
MKLTILERLVLLDLLPAEADFVTLKILRQLREALSFTEEEIAEYGIALVPGESGRVNVDWNHEHDAETKEVKFGAMMLGLVIRLLKEMDEAKKLGERHWSLLEKFDYEKEVKK